MSRKYDLGPLTYNYANDYLGSKESRLIDYNTYLIRDSDSILVRFYHTAIVQFFPDGSIELNTGEWDTVTTRERMNEVLGGIEVFVQDHEWCVSIKGTNYLYHDHMIIRPDGTSDAMKVGVYAINNVVQEEISSEEDAAELISSYTIKALKSLWRKCNRGRDLIVYYAPIVFIPLIIPRASGNEYWYPTAVNRLTTG